MTNENNTVKEAIKAYLDKRAAEDELFAGSYAKPNKSIDKCFNYIIGEVKKKGNSVYMSDEEVFGMAVHYYDEDDIKVENLPGNMRTRVSSGDDDIKLTDAEKAEIKKRAEQRYEEQCIKELKKKETEKAKKRLEARRAAQANEQSLFGQMLFGMEEMEQSNSNVR